MNNIFIKIGLLSCLSFLFIGPTIGQNLGGGDIDGFDKDQFAGVMNGTSLAGLFGGGDADGFDKARFDGVMNGTDLAVLF